MYRLTAALAALAVFQSAASLAKESETQAGFAAVDITPQVGGDMPVYIAGYGMDRQARGIHDPLFARAVVLAAGAEKIAIVAVDLIGLQYPAVKAIRAKLPQMRYVTVASTHNHEGPDVIGIWGRGPFHRGVDDAYLQRVIERVVQAVQEAESRLVSVTAAYGTAEDETLLGDSRLPIVKDGVLRVLRLNLRGSNRVAGVVVQWNCHPESLGSRNTLITADFPWATIAALERKYGCPVVYLSGAVGGLMGLPDGRIKDDAGREIPDGNYDYARRYGEEVAALAARAIDSAEPLPIAPLAIHARPIAVPLENFLYRTARALRVISREGVLWTGDFENTGVPESKENAELGGAVETEVAYVRLGELHLACIPGELYPELVYGKFQEPVEPNADFPDAPLEPTITSLMPGRKWLLIGLANDEVGYIIPKRQWDKRRPFAYGKPNGQYGEINSCGPRVAPIIMEALKRRIAEAKLPIPMAEAGKE